MTINFCNSEVLEHLRTKFPLGELYMFCKVYSERCNFVATGNGNPILSEDYYDAEWWDEAAENIMLEIRQSPKLKTKNNGEVQEDTSSD